MGQSQCLVKVTDCKSATSELDVAKEREAFSVEQRLPVIPPSQATDNAVLQFMATAEGFYDFTENRYIYRYKDHLGNTRLSYARNTQTNTLEILDKNDYYPFGMNHLNPDADSFFGQGSYKNHKYNGKELQETGMYDYGWRMYMPDIGRWNAMDQLSESYMSHSPYGYVMNNPVMMTDPDGRYHQLSQAFESAPDFNNNPQKYIMGGSGGRSASWNTLNLWMATVGNSTPTHTPHGNTAGNAASNESNLGTNSYDGDMRTINIPESILKGQISTWGRQIFEQFNGYMSGWNAQDGFDNLFNLVQNHPKEVTSIAGMIKAGSTIAEKGLANWNSPSSITKSKVFAEKISTKLPFSAKELGNASPVLKGLGTTVGIIGLTNTAYQYSQGNISGTRAVFDGVMGIAGFFPATAWVSIGYFGVMAISETYYNDGKPLF